MAARRVGLESSATRIVILDATEQLMLEEGYAAVSTRRVAGKAGLKPPLVHYYFPKTDDLLLAVYRRSAERNQERLAKALASETPLQALWMLNTDAMRTGLAVEFMGMATHRKVIRDEIAHYVQRSRSAQAETLTRLFSNQKLDPSVCPPSGVSMLIAGISRSLIMEEALGISSGHAEAVAFVEWWLQRLDADRASRSTG